MSDLDLSNPFDPDGFEHRPDTMPRRLTPPDLKPDPQADSGFEHRPDMMPRRLPPPDQPPADEAPAAAPSAVESALPEEKAGAGPTPWKGAASSVPKLRQQPAPLPAAVADEAFQGFAQDAMEVRGHAAMNEARATADADPDDLPRTPKGPLAQAPPAWELWLDRARALPLPMVLGVCGVIVLTVVLVQVFSPRDRASVSLSRIRQHPEAFDGQRVAVSGKAGEGFMVGGNYVFNLRQGRDTIVVYSRTRRPSLHERVQATGTVSIGYLDGAPRVALFEEPPTP